MTSQLSWYCSFAVIVIFILFCCCFPSCLSIVRLCWMSQIPSEDRPETVPREWLLSSTPASSPFQWCLHPWLYLDWPLSWYWTKLHWMVDSHKFKDQLFTDILRAQCMTSVSSVTERLFSSGVEKLTSNSYRIRGHLYVYSLHYIKYIVCERIFYFYVFNTNRSFS